MKCAMWREHSKSSHLQGFKQKGVYLAPPPHLIVHSASRIIPDNKLLPHLLFLLSWQGFIQGQGAG